MTTDLIGIRVNRGGGEVAKPPLAPAPARRPSLTVCARQRKAQRQQPNEWERALAK